MIKILKNTTILDIIVVDTGVTVPASGQYTIPPQDYALWVASSDVLTFINAGTLVVNNGIEDLSIVRGTKHITDVLATSVFFADNTNNGFTNLDGLRVNNITPSSFSPRKTKITTTTNGTSVLTVNSNFIQIAGGSAIGFKYQLPDATTLTPGWQYQIINTSVAPIVINYNGGTLLTQIPPMWYAYVTLDTNVTSNGVWVTILGRLADLSTNNPEFANTKHSFEDFLFKSYGANSNAYNFIATNNAGDSNMDGSVSVVGSDYEGIHTLATKASSSARPLLEAFNGTNRIKLGAQSEAYEIRIRIDSLATTSNKFTARYGLMDDTLIGVPANGVIFSYDPIYPVTPVAQVVTVTPVVTSQAPTQVFTETLNGTPYTYTFITTKTVTTTPNSFPNATYQVVNFTWTRANNTLYTITINGTTVSYTSDADATNAEIAAGLGGAINSNPTLSTVVSSTTTGKPIVVTSLILGTAFTYTQSANMNSTLVTANVPIAQYTQTINGTPFTYVSDGTPTATEVVTGLKNLINADGPLPVTATGTTTLILTADVAGADFTHSPSSNMSTVDNTPTAVATTVVSSLSSSINADGPLPITASGTTTLILTADVAGTAFTYSGTSNLTQVLTTANVVEVLYSGNWVFTIINSSTAVSADTNIPIVAGQWYKVKMITKADGSSAYYYIDNVFIGELVTALPSVAMRYVFKLEKTLGTTSVTTSIDYITWRRDRG